MHKSQNYINLNILLSAASPQQLSSCVITRIQSAALAHCLREDSISYAYSSAVSIGDAISGIKKGLYTWATVKLYYATFYALRSLLGTSNVCIFYSGSKAWSCDINAGAAPIRRNGQTHKVVLSEFGRKMPTHLLLTQQIEAVDPLDWLMGKRENANYGDARFVEPETPRYFEKIDMIGIRLAIPQYLDDPYNLYTFDPEHAILAFPLQALKYSLMALYSLGVKANSIGDIKFLKSLFVDNKGPIPEALKLFENA